MIADVDLRRCVNCDGPFEPLGDWHRECRGCFRDRKKRELAQLQAVNEGLRDEVARLEAEIEQLRDTTRAEFDQDFLRKLLQLCHPDRHQGSELATEVTGRLLAMRRQAKTRV